MKIIKDNKAYATSIFLLILLIPVLMLMIISIDHYSHDVDNTADNIQSRKIKAMADNFEEEIATVTKQSLHEVSLNVTTNKKPLRNSRQTIKEDIQNKINKRIKQYDDYSINCQITDIENSNDPFKIEVTYSVTITKQASKVKINRQNTQEIELTDKSYPVYDSLPVLKTNANLKYNTTVFFNNNLVNYINIDNASAYRNSTAYPIIRKCPYTSYNNHGDNNQTILNCIQNHYYHNSHDGLCFFCRLENRTSCSDYGFETFILPREHMDKAPVSIDHVLLNDKSTQYPGGIIQLNNTTFIYLDNGHKTKYGL